MIEILIVESYEVMREGLRALIATEPDMVVIGEAIDSSTAIEQAYFLHPDIVMVDPMSLGHDSIQTISSIKQVHPKTRILVLTNYIDKGEVQAALQAGARGYMLKGTAAPELIQAIRDVFQGKLVLQPTIANILTKSSS
ncbi:MAG: response regulator transcription factor [Chloroflexota bacterium]